MTPFKQTGQSVIRGVKEIIPGIKKHPRDEMEVDPNPSTSQASQPTQTPPPGTTAVAPYEIWGLLDGRQHPFRVILDPDQTIFDLRDVLFRDYIENYSVGPFRRAHRDDINFTKVRYNSLRIHTGVTNTLCFTDQRQYLCEHTANWIGHVSAKC